MVAEVKSDAPELALDAQTQSGFVKWFNSLPKVWGGWGGGVLEGGTRRRRRAHARRSACLKQQAQKKT